MRAAAATLLVLSGTAAAAPGVRAVHSEVGEARACLPLASGGALVGTGGGLVRIDDGGEVRGVWTATDGLPGTRIETIADVDGALWIGTDAGAARVTLAGNALRVVRALPGRGVRDIVGVDGATYAATWDGGVIRLDGKAATGAPIAFAGDKQSGARARVAGLAATEDDHHAHTLYAGTAAGLYRLDGGRFARIATPELPPTATIAALRADGARLWIATTDGLYAREADGSLRAYGGGDLRHVSVGADIIAAGVADGLVHVDHGRLAALPGAPRELAIAEAIATRGDATCAGGLDGAWLRRDASAPWIHAAHRAGPPSNDISALAADGDRLWVGTFDHGLAVREHGAWRAIVSPELDARVNAIYVEPRAHAASRIWVATANGLTTLDGPEHADISRTVRQDGLPGRGVVSLARLRDGRMMAGTSWGAVLVGGAHPTKIGPPDVDLGAVWALAEDADGQIWLGTTTGLYRGALGGDHWTRYSLATGQLRDDWVMSIAVRDRTLFVGTYHGGVSRLDLAPGTGDVTATQLGDGWINPGGLALADGVLYASTMDGLRVGDGVTATWTTQANLPGKDTTAAVRVGGTLWVATRRGLAELAELE